MQLALPSQLSVLMAHSFTSAHDMPFPVYPLLQVHLCKAEHLLKVEFFCGERQILTQLQHQRFETSHLHRICTLQTFLRKASRSVGAISVAIAVVSTDGAFIFIRTRYAIPSVSTIASASVQSGVFVKNRVFLR